MMNTYTITNDHTGINYGTYDGDTPNEAIVAMFYDAGYGDDVVWLTDDDEIEICNDEYRELLGDCWTARAPEVHEMSATTWAKLIGEAIQRHR